MVCLQYSGGVAEALDRLEASIDSHSESVDVPKLQLSPGTVVMFGYVKPRKKATQAVPLHPGPAPVELPRRRECTSQGGTTLLALNEGVQGNRADASLSRVTEDQQIQASCPSQQGQISTHIKRQCGLSRSPTLKDEQKPAIKRPRCILDRTTMVTRKGCTRRFLRRRRYGGDPDASPFPATQSHALSGHYLPRILAVGAKPRADDSHNANQALKRNQHVLTPCGHTIYTSKPSSCGSNCACETDIKLSEPAWDGLQPHPCTVCIEEQLNDIYQEKCDYLLSVRPVLTTILGRNACDELLKGRLDACQKIWTAERQYLRRIAMTKQIERCGRKPGSECYTFDKADIGGDRSFKRRSGYRGLDRSDDLARIRVQVGGTARARSMKKARERSPVDSKADYRHDAVKAIRTGPDAELWF